MKNAENSNSEPHSSFKCLVLKYKQLISAVGMLLLLYVALIASILCGIDGFGIFAITGGILVFCFLIFHKPKVIAGGINTPPGGPPDDGGGINTPPGGLPPSGGGDNSVQENMAAIVDAISDPNMKNHILPQLLPLLIPLISSNLDLLKPEQLQQLGVDVRTLDAQIKAKDNSLESKLYKSGPRKPGL